MVGDSIVDSLLLCHAIDSVTRTYVDTVAADKWTRRYYRDTHTLLWLTPGGFSSQADTLMKYLDRVGETGMRKELFFTEEIAADRLRLDSLDFSEVDMYTVISRLDYNLTRAFVRYSAWQHYGLVRPRYVLNHLDYEPHDTTRTAFRPLYDIPTEVIGEKGYRRLIRIAGTDSVATVLRTAEPSSPLYLRLKEKLRTAEGSERTRILVNMERCRWQHPSRPEQFPKYVVVNIPSYELIGVDADTILTMRIVCGSNKTKTPLIHSDIMRMDVNPRWMMPASVIRHEISHHAGDSAYFARHRYHILDRETNEPLSPRHTTRQQFEKCLVRVYQEGGEGNALGRIIFRFDNNFSIFLHDTSTKGTFSNQDRRASHGCIRVSEPFELARFLMADRDEKTLEKLKYSMEYHGALDVKDDKSTPDVEGPDPTLLIHGLKVTPAVPLFITYYTLYLLPDGTLMSYPDVYGYDKAIARRVTSYDGVAVTL